MLLGNISCTIQIYNTVANCIYIAIVSCVLDSLLGNGRTRAKAIAGEMHVALTITTIYSTVRLCRIRAGNGKPKLHGYSSRYIARAMHNHSTSRSLGAVFCEPIVAAPIVDLTAVVVAKV